MKKVILFSLIFFISSVGAAQHLGFKIMNGKKRVTIPFELHNNLIVIPVVLENSLPLKFILDTGVRNAILIDKIYGDFLNLQYSKRYTITGVGTDQFIQAYIANNISLTLPGIHGNGHAILILEDDHLALKNYLGMEVHGIIGYELFSRFIVKIDYRNKYLTFIDPQFFRERMWYQKIPMEIEDTKPYINAKVRQDDGSVVDLKLLIDTGSSQSLIIQHSTDTNKLVIPEKTIYRNIGRGLGGEIKGYIGRILQLDIGKSTMESVIANYPTDEYYFNEFEGQKLKRNGAIGGEILKRFNVVFDYAGGAFYFRKNSNFGDNFDYNLSGLVVKAIGPDLKTFVVDDVEDDSSGKRAGVLKGDTIQAINGRQSRYNSLNNVIQTLNYKKGKKIKLKLLRDGEEITTTFVLESII